MRRVFSCLFFVVAVFLCSAGPAVADKEAEAELLFEEARALLEAGQMALACEKFQESQDLDSSLGTLLNLGECLDKLGKTASAWHAFTQAAKKAARESQRRHRSLALKRAGQLEMTISKIIVRTRFVPEPGFVLTRNGADVTSTLGQAVALDPGTYKFQASAPGRRNYRTVRIVRDTGQTIEVQIPVLKIRLERTAAKKRKDKRRRRGETAPDSKQENASYLAAFRISGGTSFFKGGDLNSSVRPALAVEASWSPLAGESAVDLGVLAAFTSFAPNEPLGATRSTRMLSLLANATYFKKFISAKLRLRLEFGVGMLAVTGLVSGHPALQKDIEIEGTLGLVQGRGAIGADYAVSQGIRLIVTPLSYWYSTDLGRKSGQLKSPDLGSGLQSSLGISASF